MAETSAVIVPVRVDDRTGKALSNIRRRLAGLGRVAQAGFKLAAGAVLGATAAVAGLALGIGALTANYIANAKEARLIAATTGVNIKEVSRLTQVFRKFGLEGEDVRDILNEVNVKLVDAQEEGTAAADAFELLGLSQADFVGLSAAESLLKIGDALNGVEDAATRAWIADGIFGGDLAQKTLPILAQGSDAIKDLADEYEKAGLVIDQESADMSQEIETNFNKIRDRLEGFGNQVALKFLPLVADITEAVVGTLEALPGALKKAQPDILNTITSFRDGDWSGAWASMGDVTAVVAGAIPEPFAGALRSVYLFSATMLQNLVNSTNEFINGINYALRGLPGYQPFDLLKPISISQAVLDQTSPQNPALSGLLDARYFKVRDYASEDRFQQHRLFQANRAAHGDDLGNYPGLDLFTEEELRRNAEVGAEIALRPPQSPNVYITVEGSILSQDELLEIINDGLQSGSIQVPRTQAY